MGESSELGDGMPLEAWPGGGGSGGRLTQEGGSCETGGSQRVSGMEQPFSRRPGLFQQEARVISAGGHGPSAGDQGLFQFRVSSVQGEFSSGLVQFRVSSVQG